MKKDNKGKNIRIISVLIICVLCLIILVLLLFYKNNFLKHEKNSTTTTNEKMTLTTEKIDRNNYHDGSLLMNDIYESSDNKRYEIYTYENIDSYKTISNIKINNVLKLLDRNYSEIFSNLGHIKDGDLKLVNGKVYLKDKIVCNFENAKYVSFRKRDIVDTGFVMSFYGYFVSGDETNIYECNVGDDYSSSKLIYTYVTNKYYDFLYEYQDDVYIKDRNDNTYNIYDNTGVSNDNDIFKIYENLTFYTNGNLYYKTNELIGRYNFKRIIYISSGCDMPNSALVVSLDNNVVSSMFGNDYRKFTKKFSDIYVKDVTKREVTLEFEDGTIEEINFGGC